MYACAALRWIYLLNRGRCRKHTPGQMWIFPRTSSTITSDPKHDALIIKIAFVLKLNALRYALLQARVLRWLVGGG